MREKEGNEHLFMETKEAHFQVWKEQLLYAYRITSHQLYLA